MTLRKPLPSAIFTLASIAVATLGLTSSLVRAQGLPLTECREQIDRLCRAQSEIREVMVCLNLHESELSVGCKQELERIALAARQAGARGGGALSALGGLNALTPPVPLLSYDGRSSPKSPALDDGKISFTLPALKTSTDTLAMSLAGAHLHLGDSIRLESGPALPVDLYRTEIGVQYFHQLPAGRNWGLRGSFGAASDNIGESLRRSPTFSLLGHYAFPGSGGFWALSIFVSNNSPFGNYIPIPGAMYLYKNATLTALIGFPVTAVQWTPVNPWSFSFFVFGPTLSTEATYGSVEDAQAFATLVWGQQNFILNDRQQEKDRLTIEEKKVALGVRTPIWNSARGEIQIGTVFDRWAYIGQGMFNKAGGSVPLTSDFFASWSLKKAF